MANYARPLTALWLLAAASFARGETSAPVHVVYSRGDTEIAKLAEGATYFSNHNYKLTGIPPEMAGLAFTRRPGGAADAELTVPAGATVYLLCGVNSGTLVSRLKKSGWTRLHDATYNGDKNLAVFKRTFDTDTHVVEKTSVSAGVVVAAKVLDVGDIDPSISGKEPERDKPHDDETAIAPTTAPDGGPTTRVASPQASIQALEIYRTESGIMLGQTSEVTLTVTPAKASRAVALTFATKTGKEMEMARDDALRFIRVTHPAWFAQKAELTFEDKYVNHDGGSIGTALGTLVLATIEGFVIDPNVAITGDISANGKVRAIGGVAAKLKGAVASKCVLVAIPSENYDQLVDGVVYNGVGLATDTQVIGIGTLADAVAAVRTDRSADLNAAIQQFADLQKASGGKPAYWKTKPAVEALTAIARIAPQHISARLLLAAAQGKLPKTLSVTASRYYVSLAVDPVMGVFKQRSSVKGTPPVESASVHAGLADLGKLRPLVDPSVRPLIAAWEQFISALDALQQRNGTQQSVERARQALLDEMTKEQTDADTLQKVLKEGI